MKKRKMNPHKSISLVGTFLVLTTNLFADLTENAIDVGHAKQLFIDSRFISLSNGITLTVNPPTKQPYRDPEKLLTQPVNAKLDFGPVFYDPSAPPEKRWKKVLRKGHMRDVKTAGLYIYYSADRVKWTAVPERVFPYYPDGESSVTYNPVLGKYLAHFRQWVERDPGKSYFKADPLPFRTIGMLILDDPLKPWVDSLPDHPTYIWGENNLPAPGVEFDVAMSPDTQDPPETDIYYSGIVRYPWADDVYLSFPVMYHQFPDEGKRSNDGLTSMQLAVSRDGINWRRFRTSYIDLGIEGGSPDSAMTNADQRALVRDGDDLCHYYFGSFNSHAVHIKEKDPSFRGMTVQRLDGFVSADAAYTGGELTTPLIIFGGDRLVLNINASALGEARVEVQNKHGVPIKGFSLADAMTMRGNSLRKTVTWKDSSISSLKGKAVRLRFVMRASKLYGFQFVKDK